VAGIAGETLLLTSSSGVDSRYWGGPIFDAEGRVAGISLPSLTPKALTSVALAAMLERGRCMPSRCRRHRRIGAKGIERRASR
jgi:hypothetical protein